MPTTAAKRPGRKSIPADGWTEPERLRVLYALVGELNSGHSLDDVIRLAHARMAAVLPYYRISLATYEAARDELVLAAVKADTPCQLDVGYRQRVGGSSLEPLIRDQRIRIIDDLEAYHRDHPQSDSTAAMLWEGARSSLTLPLVLEGRPVGVLFFSCREPKAYHDGHVALLQGVAGHIATIVEKARLADTLMATRQRLESILQNSADGIIVLDMENIVTHWNAGAERIFGYSAAEITGRSFTLLMPEELRRSGELDRIAADVLQKGFLTNYETQRVTKLGRAIVVNITSTLLRGADGVPFGRSSVVRDVTALKAMQEELLRTRHLAALGEMAASVAHQIRNPLTGIRGAIQVLRGNLPDGDGRIPIMDEILTNTTRLDNTVRHLLEFAKPWNPARQPCRLTEVVGHVIEGIRAQPQFQSIRFRLEEPQPVTASADPLLLREILINLFENAAYALKGDGEIVCAADIHSQAARLRIRDQGTGIPPDVCRQLFRPFFTTKTSGNGLGLAICRKIMDAHGGTMSLESELGKGTEVTLRFPME